MEAILKKNQKETTQWYVRTTPKVGSQTKPSIKVARFDKEGKTAQTTHR